MFVMARTLVYGTGFVALLLVFLPARVLSAAGITRPAHTGPLQLLALGIMALGSALAVWCILTFVRVGHGTPAPFDPPRRLVVLGPYRYIRNPMYVGATVALAGAALYFGSAAVLAYAGAFLLAMHLFVVLYEEHALRRGFGQEYEAYCRETGRWWPRGRPAGAPGAKS